MTDTFQVSLKYAGSDVDDGSMSIEDMTSALIGFHGAYSKIVAYRGGTTRHSLRVTALEKGSTDIVMQAIEFIYEHQTELEVGAKALTAVSGIIGGILGVIKLVKHGKGKPVEVKVSGNNNVVVLNSENVPIEVSKDIYEIFKKGIIKSDLAKIVDPLESSKIDSTKITARYGNEKMEGDISSAEKVYFTGIEEEVTKTHEMELIGEMRSLNKDRNGGSFYLQDNTRISYKIIATNPEDLYPNFLHKGVVKAKCVAHLDKNLKPIWIEIHSITPIQGEFGK